MLSRGLSPFGFKTTIYLRKDPTGPGQKLKFKYAGPFIIHEIRSPHMFIIKDLNTQKCLPRAIHINRLKSAYVRQPNPIQYLMDSVETKARVTTDQELSSDIESTVDDIQVRDKESTTSDVDALASREKQKDDETSQKSESNHTNQKNDLPPLRRSSRMRKKQSRFDDENFTDLEENSTTSDGSRYYKFKRILAQKRIDGTIFYLAHFAGEPAQNSSWVKESQLDPKTRQLVRTRPPPQII